MESLDLNNYTVYELRDCNDSDVVYGAIALNNKHTVRDFQNEINRVKNEFEDEIAQYGDDWSIIQENIDNKFDWFELGLNDGYLEY